MIRINLLPHRELKREANKRQFNVMLGVTAAVSALFVLLGSTLISNKIDYQMSRNTRLDNEIAKLDEEISTIKGLKTQIRLMLDRKKVVEDLQRNRNQSVVILDELSRQVPDGMYFKEIKQNGNEITISGVADTNARVATMVRNLDSSHWLNSPSLVEIKSVMLDKEKQNAFTLNVDIRSQQLDLTENIAVQHAPVH